jgi:argininosuccinate synthase
VHEGQLLDPVCRDIEALFLSSQERVTGKVHVCSARVVCSSRASNRQHSLMAVSRGVYGEAAGEWTPQDALGFSKIVSLTGMFHARGWKYE